MERGSGVLLPMAALPSPNGIGCMGASAFDFIDFLADAGQKYWQLLPLGLTGPGGTPYTSPSSFAGNPDYIDLETLVSDGLLEEDELPRRPEGTADYGFLRENRPELLRLAYKRGGEKYRAAVDEFAADKPWLENYAEFAALQEKFGGAPWYSWPEGAKRRESGALDVLRREMADDVRRHKFLQWLFFRQYTQLRRRAGEKGVLLIGDMPIYVALDSADVWAEPWYFRLDGNCAPIEAAGVPPDYFCEDGQLWGNPLYNWDAMRADGWGWWIRRMDGAARLYDAVRIDHFRALASYWAVPFGESSAKNGVWREGPGMELLGTLKNWFSGTSFIAEDLGMLTPDVHELLRASGLPGMKVLEFAFSPDAASSYLPHRYERNCVCYAGTHDNNTVLGWLDDIGPEERAFAAKYMGVSEGEGWCRAMLRTGMSSVADVFIAQMQDLLEKPADCRTNIPGTAEGNWRWRMKPGECTPALAAELLEMTKMYGRL